MKFFLDENFPKKATLVLDQFGHTVFDILEKFSFKNECLLLTDKKCTVFK